MPSFEETAKAKFYEELDKMTTSEINNYRTILKGKITKLNNKITKRNNYLINLKKTKAERKADPEIAAMKAEAEEIAHTISIIKDYKREHQAQIALEMANAQAEIKRMQRDEWMDELAAYDEKIETAHEIEKIRPAAPRICFGSEFRKCSTSERRLVSMMAREIGLERYQQLRKIAFWDEKMNRRRES